ncbi:hypothetical protein K432DRAFT_377008 [Lepidopterella palustris CBS 459.81]|uniref:Transcription factor Rba50 n=1 Tax=Lepidopterella palustris CBS 459.81 TaxID=1314670 RepID=A0A8E2JLB4_9PEZI|nr:hypothetical protein K432DRAFT_377008 [Lepidopterella palustris CBS 459.81]
MSYARGERFVLDLDSDQEGDSAVDNKTPTAPPLTDFIRDIKERNPVTAKPPTSPTLKNSTTGFPAHKKRNKVSAFKQQRAAKPDQISEGASIGTGPPKHDPTFEEVERRKIDEENRQRLAEMLPEEIERERQELFDGLSPGLIQRLLARANLDDGRNEQDFDSEIPLTDKPSMKTESSGKKVTFDTSNLSESSSPVPQNQPASFASNQTTAPPQPSSTSSPQKENQPQLPTIHFPHPPQPPELDPSSTTFLSDLHEKYFPTLPYDPSSLAWMAPLDPSDTSSPYHPSQRSLSASELRFSFKGALLPPRLASQISVTKGLHHHGDAPEAAGYTIPELARLARSAVSAQRCIAYQTLGRILYRLGRGEFGEEEGEQKVDGPVQIAKDPGMVGEEDDEEETKDGGSAMARGLWECIDEGRVLETLMEEAERDRGHLTAKTYAQEALWNWRRGGGRKRKAV